MRTNALLKLHQREVDILDMIVSCDNRINNAKNDLRKISANNNTWEQKIWNQYTRAEEHYTDRVKRTELIKNRLVRYYLDVKHRIDLLTSSLISTEIESDFLTQEKLS